MSHNSAQPGEEICRRIAVLRISWLVLAPALLGIIAPLNLRGLRAHAFNSTYPAVTEWFTVVYSQRGVGTSVAFEPIPSISSSVKEYK